MFSKRVLVSTTAAIVLAALPMTAQICSCYFVSKSAFCDAVEAGCTTIGALKIAT